MSRVAVSGRIGLSSVLVLMVLSRDSLLRSCGAVGFQLNTLIQSQAARIPDHDALCGCYSHHVVALRSSLMVRNGGADVAG